MWNTPEEANYLRTTIAGPQNCPHNVAQRGFENKLFSWALAINLREEENVLADPSGRAV
jgi:hypothetical protein